MAQDALLKETEMALQIAFDARCFAFACFALMVYDHSLTFDRELEYFWSGSWTISRILFFSNRYMSPCAIIFGLVANFVPDSPVIPCKVVNTITFVLELACVTTVGIIIFFRIWYLYSRTRAAQFIAMICFFACTTSSWVVLGIMLSSSSHNSSASSGFGCVASVKAIWRMDLPILLLHIVLYGFTAYCLLFRGRESQNSPVLQRLLRDNGLLFTTILLSLGLNMSAAFRPDLFAFSRTVLGSSSMVTFSSIAISRLMLDLRSLAADLGLEIDWSLSPSELGRVNWKVGKTDCELLVEVPEAQETEATEESTGIQIENRV